MVQLRVIQARVCSVLAVGGHDGFDVQITDFTFNLGIFSSMVVELRALCMGLGFAWKQGFHQVMVEVFSQLVIQYLNENVSNAHPLQFLI